MAAHFRRRGGLLARGALILLAVAAVMAATASPAQAHAVLERSLPVQNQRLAEPPELVETWYSEPLERSLTELRVLDTQGDEVHAGETRFSDEDANYAAIALPPDLGPGIYTVTYQNVSKVDGHTWSGSFSFIVLNPDGSVPAGTPFRPEGFGGGEGLLPGVGDSGFRWLGLLAAVALVGAAAFSLLIARPAAGFLKEGDARAVEEAASASAAGVILLAAPALAISLLGELFLLVDRLGGLDLIDDVLFHTRTGSLWLARLGLALVLLGLAAPALASAHWRSGLRAGAPAALALAGGLGLLMTYSLDSHANAGAGIFWAVASDFIHFAATAAWLGGLAQLPLAFWWSRRRLGERDRLLYLANVLDRFSWLAVVSVALLIGTGVFNGFAQLPARPALWETTYGRVLIAKLALIVPLLAVAGLNTLLVKPRLVAAIDALYAEEPSERPRGEEEARLQGHLARLRWALPRTVAAEFLLGAAVLASVSLLAQSTTADGELRVKASEPAGDFVATARASDLTVGFTISPFTLGINTFTARLEPAPAAGQGEITQVELRALLDDPNVPASAGRGFTSQELAPAGEPGVFAAEAALLTQPGDWRLELRIRRRGLDDEGARFSVPEVGGYLARPRESSDLLDLPFTAVDWNIVGGAALLAVGLGMALVWRNRPPSWQPSTGASVGAAGVFAVVAGVVLVFGVRVGEETVPRDSPVPVTQESLAIGQRLYENNCQVCHGAQGEGSDLAPSLLVHVPAHADGTLFVWVSEGIPINFPEKRMASFKGQLSEEERWHLINFLRTEYGEGEITFVLPPTETAEPAATPGTGGSTGQD